MVRSVCCASLSFYEPSDYERLVEAAYQCDPRIELVVRPTNPRKAARHRRRAMTDR